MSMPRSGWDEAVKSMRVADAERYDDEPEHDDPVVCPQCMGPAALLGQLGRVVHLRCVDCGWTFAEDDGLKEVRS